MERVIKFTIIEWKRHGLNYAACQIHAGNLHKLKDSPSIPAMCYERYYQQYAIAKKVFPCSVTEKVWLQMAQNCL